MNTIFVMGSLHGFMLEHPQYTLREFMAAITRFKPDLILTEARATHPDVNHACIDGGLEQALVFAYGTANNVAVKAVDWFNEEFINELSLENSSPNTELENAINPLFEEYRKHFLQDSFFELHSESSQKLIQQIYETAEKHGQRTSRKRNEHICMNIDHELIQVQNQRILIIFGLDHKYFIDNHLAAINYSMADANNLDIKNFRLPQTIRTQALENIKSSQALLKKQIEENHYSGEYHIRMLNKAREFKLWYDGVSEIPHI